MSVLPACTASVLILIVPAILAGSSSTAAGQQVVTVDGSGFAPSELTIDVGDSVMWLNLDAAGPHTTTSDKPMGDLDHWDVTLDYLEIYTRTFVRAGTFTYRDVAGGFTGTIFVGNPNVPLPRLETPIRLDDQFIFAATGLTPGKTNVLLASTNLVDWTPIQTNTAPGSSMTFSNATSPGNQFYRLAEQH